MTSLSLNHRNWLLLLIIALSTNAEAQDMHDDYGIVNVSVCNTRADADYNAGQESQALMGMPVKILGKNHEWTQIETPEGYIHWTLSAAVQKATRLELSQWNHAEQIVVTALTTWIYSQPTRHSQTVSDAVGGCRLRLIGKKKGYYHVAYPDGRQGYIAKEDAMPRSKWQQTVRHDAESILRTARTLMGVPYMWGGTSPKGVDCSGFVRTVLMMHDIVIPRNASQQARTGQHIDIAEDFSNLQPGDLLFFGSKNADGTPKRVVHVGFYVGGKHFIHSLGCVRTASFDPADAEYDEYDLHRLLYATRILPYIDKEDQLHTTAHLPLYQ